MEVKEFIDSFNELERNKGIIANVNPEFFFEMSKKLIDRIKELEELEEEHRKINGELQKETTDFQKCWYHIDELCKARDNCEKKAYDSDEEKLKWSDFDLHLFERDIIQKLIERKF